MSGFRVEVDAAGALVGLREARAVLRVEARRGVARTGAYTRTLIRANASTGTHRPGLPHIPGAGPGPNVATGDLRRSISQTNEAAAGIAVSEVGTNAVQAARLEFGFIGADSLGRHYEQPAYPFIGPAEPAAIAFMEAEMGKAADAVDEALGGTGG